MGKVAVPSAENKGSQKLLTKQGNVRVSFVSIFHKMRNVIIILGPGLCRCRGVGVIAVALQHVRLQRRGTSYGA